MTARDDKKVALPEPDVYKYQYWSSGPRVDWSRIKLDHTFSSPWSDGYVVGDPHFSFGKLESYAAARVAEATAELRTKLAESEASDAESMAMYRSARARADELQRRVAELEEVVEAVAAMNEEHPLFLGSDLSKEEINEIGGDAAHVTDTALILRKILSDRERGKT